MKEETRTKILDIRFVWNWSIFPINGYFGYFIPIFFLPLRMVKKKQQKRTNKVRKEEVYFSSNSSIFHTL